MIWGGPGNTMGSKSGLRGPLGFDATSVKATHYQWEISTRISAKIHILNTFVNCKIGPKKCIYLKGVMTFMTDIIKSILFDARQKGLFIMSSTC